MSMATRKPRFVVKALFATWVFPRVAVAGVKHDATTAIDVDPIAAVIRDIQTVQIHVLRIAYG